MSRPVTIIDRDPNRIDEALAWYQNGTLSDDDRRWVEQRLAADPALRERLDFDVRTARGFEALAASVPADIGWAGLQERIRADVAERAASGSEATGSQGPASNEAASNVTASDVTASKAIASVTAHDEPASLEEAVRISRARHEATAGSGQRPGQRAGRRTDREQQGLFGSFLGWLGGFLTPQVGAALATLLVIQTVAVGFLLGTGQQPDTAVDYRSVGAARPVMMIRVLFDEAVTERQLREGLVAQRATIVEGPNALGEYWLATRSDPEEVAQALQKAGLVASYVIDQRVVPK